MKSLTNHTDKPIYLVCHNEGFDPQLLVAHYIKLDPGLTMDSGQPSLTTYKTEVEADAKLQSLVTEWAEEAEFEEAEFEEAEFEEAEFEEAEFEEAVFDMQALEVPVIKTSCISWTTDNPTLLIDSPQSVDVIREA